MEAETVKKEQIVERRGKGRKIEWTEKMLHDLNYYSEQRIKQTQIAKKMKLSPMVVSRKMEELGLEITRRKTRRAKKAESKEKLTSLEEQGIFDLKAFSRRQLFE